MIKKFVLFSPAILAALYVFAPVSLAYLNSGAATHAWFTAYAVFISGISLGIQIGWPASVLYLLKRQHIHGNSIKLNKGFVFLGATIVGLAIGFFLVFVAQNGNYEPYDAVGENLMTVIGFGTVLSFFLFFWSVSAAMTDAENLDAAPTMRKVAGFLSLFYFFIGIFFLSSRARKILSLTG